MHTSSSFPEIAPSEKGITPDEPPNYDSITHHRENVQYDSKLLSPFSKATENGAPLSPSTSLASPARSPPPIHQKPRRKPVKKVVDAPSDHQPVNTAHASSSPALKKLENRSALESSTASSEENPYTHPRKTENASKRHTFVSMILDDDEPAVVNKLSKPISGTRTGTNEPNKSNHTMTKSQPPLSSDSSKISKPNNLQEKATIKLVKEDEIQELNVPEHYQEKQASSPTLNKEGVEKLTNATSTKEPSSSLSTKLGDLNGTFTESVAPLKLTKTPEIKSKEEVKANLQPNRESEPTPSSLAISDISTTTATTGHLDPGNTVPQSATAGTLNKSLPDSTISLPIISSPSSSSQQTPNTSISTTHSSLEQNPKQAQTTVPSESSLDNNNTNIIQEDNTLTENDTKLSNEETTEIPKIVMNPASSPQDSPRRQSSLNTSHNKSNSKSNFDFGLESAQNIQPNNTQLLNFDSNSSQSLHPHQSYSYAFSSPTSANFDSNVQSYNETSNSQFPKPTNTNSNMQQNHPNSYMDSYDINNPPNPSNLYYENQDYYSLTPTQSHISQCTNNGNTNTNSQQFQMQNTALQNSPSRSSSINSDKSSTSIPPLKNGTQLTQSPYSANQSQQLQSTPGLTRNMSSSSTTPSFSHQQRFSNSSGFSNFSTNNNGMVTKTLSQHSRLNSTSSKISRVSSSDSMPSHSKNSGSFYVRELKRRAATIWCDIPSTVWGLPIGIADVQHRGSSGYSSVNKNNARLKAGSFYHHGGTSSNYQRRTVVDIRHSQLTPRLLASEVEDDDANYPLTTSVTAPSANQSARNSISRTNSSVEMASTSSSSALSSNFNNPNGYSQEESANYNQFADSREGFSNKYDTSNAHDSLTFYGSMNKNSGHANTDAYSDMRARSPSIKSVEEDVGKIKLFVMNPDLSDSD